jgi:hypothetical protein
MLMLDYFAVGKTGAVLRSDNFAECKIVVASLIIILTALHLFFLRYLILILVLR